MEVKSRRYSDEKLLIFAENIKRKIEKAKETIMDLNSEGNDTTDTARSFEVLEKASFNHELDKNRILIERQQKFIQDLERAQIRIKNKTYGVCAVTGDLIPEKRLLSVPHTSCCIYVKEQKAGKSFRHLS